MSSKNSPKRDLVIFIVLLFCGIITANFNVQIPHTSVIIDVRWIFGFIGIVLIRRWFLTLIMFVMLSIPYGGTDINFFVGFFGNMTYSIPIFVIAYHVNRKIFNRLDNIILYGLSWFLMILVMYQILTTPFIWAILAVIDKKPIIPNIIVGWKLQPFLIESFLVGTITASVVAAVRSHRRLKSSEEKYRALIMQSSDCLILHRLDGSIVDVNPASCKTYGYSHDELTKMNVGDLDPDYQERADDGEFYDRMPENETMDFEARQINRAGRIFPVEVRLSKVEIEGTTYIQGLCRDISEKKQAQEKRKEIEEQLKQSQRLETVGQLAGGIAHDFNNMLNVILGYSDIALSELSENDSLYCEIKEIHSAAQHSADLTRQLLAFARRQTIKPQVLDVNATVTSMLKMLRRLIGEDIDLVWHTTGDIEPVKMDPAQIEQIFVNLVVNARDAIDTNGKITIETEQVVIDEEYCETHSGFMPGSFVMLAVSDNGHGMDKEVVQHVFEPFFTTKPTGVGTGLGLSTVYGIVKQNQGFINVYSEIGIGTSFKIYLPVFNSDDENIQISVDHIHIEQDIDKATVLVVEDESSILELAAAMLKRLGHNPITIKKPEEAIALVNDQKGIIDLLITDVVMPGMNGRELADRIKKIDENIRIIYMSGYTANVIAHHGVLKRDVLFLQKPFTKQQLSDRIVEALNQRP